MTTDREQLGLFEAPVPPKRTWGGRTQSTDEAMDLLKRQRAELITRAREVARRIALRDGTVHSRQVRAAMAGELDADSSEFWLGAVFREGFEWTGDYHTYSDPDRNIHERMVKVWRLR